MALSIQTNIASLQAQMNLNKASQSLSKNQERLSTGLRINSAADDAAGLAISDRMTAQIRGLNQASMNANDGISLAKTAEGALDETTNILQRMRELAVQSANDSNTADDRASIQAEVDQLIEEVDRIAENTNYNTKTLLDGSLTSNVFQVGSNSNETISFGISGAKASDLGTFGGVSGGEFQVASTQSNVKDHFTNVTAGNSLTALNSGALTINGTEINASLSGDDTVSSTDNSGSAIAIAEAINKHAETTGVTAKAEQTQVEFDFTTDGNLGSGDLVINGHTIGSVTTETTDANAATNLVNAINAKSNDTGVQAETNGTLTIALTAVDGRNVSMEAKSNSTDILSDFDDDGDIKTVRGQVSLYSNESFEISGDNPNSVGFSPGGEELSSSLVDVADTTNNTFEDLQAGDLIINGYSVDAASADDESNIDDSGSALAVMNAINGTDGLSSEVEATATNEANLGKVSAVDSDDTGTFSINGEEITVDADITDGDSTGALVAAINGKTSDTGVVASINDNDELVLTADDGRNIDVEIDGDGNTANRDYLGNVNMTEEFHIASKGTVTLEAKEGYSIESVEGDRKALAGIANQNGLISNLDVTTKTGAQNAIDSIDEAISQVDQTKADLGAIQNRFDSTISNLDNVQQNITDARSRIMDADIAKEAAEMTQNNVRQQAAASVLTQANQNPQLALQLLGG